MFPLDLLARKSDFRQLLDREAPRRLALKGGHQPALHDAQSSAHQKS